MFAVDPARIEARGALSSCLFHPAAAPARPAAIDLFCGAGGLSLGFEQAGFDVLAAAEYDPIHAAVYRYNFPLTPVVCTDISIASSTTMLLEAYRLGAYLHGRTSPPADIDVVIGGPPCQGFSSGGRRQQLDSRNLLVRAFADRVCELGPRYFVMENVPGITWSPYVTLLQDAIQRLESGGYQVISPVRLLNASDYGVPQDRARSIILGWRLGERPIDYPSRASTASPTVWEAIRDIADLCRPNRVRGRDEVTITEREALRASERASDYAARLRDSATDADDYSWKRVTDDRLLANVRPTNHAEHIVERFRATLPGRTDSISRYRRLSPHGIANTLRAGTGRERGAHTSPRPIHPFQDRVITVREAARLHSFPDWFRFHSTNWHGFRQVGNAVPPLLARSVAKAVLDGLERGPTRPTQMLDLGSRCLLTMGMTTAAGYFLADQANLPGPRPKVNRPPAPAAEAEFRSQGD